MPLYPIEQNRRRHPVSPLPTPLPPPPSSPTHDGRSLECRCTARRGRPRRAGRAPEGRPRREDGGDGPRQRARLDL